MNSRLDLKKLNNMFVLTLSGTELVSRKYVHAQSQHKYTHDFFTDAWQHERRSQSFGCLKDERVLELMGPSARAFAKRLSGDPFAFGTGNTSRPLPKPSLGGATLARALLPAISELPALAAVGSSGGLMCKALLVMLRVITESVDPGNAATLFGTLGGGIGFGKMASASGADVVPKLLPTGGAGNANVSPFGLTAGK